MVDVSTQGYITRGDGLSETDQAAGEPPVPPDHEIGRILTLGGSPIVVPLLGAVARGTDRLVQEHPRAVLPWALLIGVGVWELCTRWNRRSPSVRLGARHLYLAAIFLSVAGVTASTLMTSGVKPVHYVATQEPGFLPHYVQAGQPAVLLLTVTNTGIIPVYRFAEPMGDLTLVNAPAVVGPRSKETVHLQSPAREPGSYKGYVRVHHYPALLPLSVVAWFHELSPALAALINSLLVGLVLALCSPLLDLRAIGSIWRRAH